MNPKSFLHSITPSVYAQFKRAVEIGKWADGRAVTNEQKATCLEAIIAYEHAYLPEQEHTGYVPAKPTSCETQPPEKDETIRWMGNKDQ